MTPIIAGHRISRLELHVPETGIWSALVAFEDAPSVSGQVTIELGDTALHGTVDAAFDGTHAAQRTCRVVGGRGGWSKVAEPRNFADVSARTVVDYLTSRNGERIGQWDLDERYRHYVVDAAPSIVHLEDIAEGAWVGYDGLTHVGSRPTASISRYEVLDYDPQLKRVALALDDLSELAVGVVLTERLDTPQTVREYTVIADADGLRATCWCSGDGELAGLLRRMIRNEVTALPLRRYRITGQDGGKLELASLTASQPDIAPISVMGAPGLSARYTPGSHALVAYEDADRRSPIVVGFSGSDAPGFAPLEVKLESIVKTTVESVAAVELKSATVLLEAPSIALSGSITMGPSGGASIVADGDTLQVGGPGGAPAARQGDTIRLPTGTVLNLVIPGLSVGSAPVACTLTTPVTGTITSGSNIVTVK